MKPAWRQQWGLILAGFAAAIAYAALVSIDWRHGTLRADLTPQTISWYLLAFFAYLGAILWSENRPVSLKWIWGAAILFRLLLLLTTPTLSDDIYRYLWDGHVAGNGVSPYAYPIDAAELDVLDNPIRGLANNSWMASPYMPVAQVVFLVAATISPLQPVFLQALMVIFDLLAALLIGKLLSLALLPARRLLIYLWNPLVVVEVAHGAHIDVWMVLLTLLALWLTLRPSRDGRIAGLDRSSWQRLAAPVALALAILTKLLPVLLIPVLFWRWTWRQWLLCGSLTVALLLPFGVNAGWGLSGDLDGRGLFGALRIYGQYWTFNSGALDWLQRLFEQTGTANAPDSAKQVALLLMLVVLLSVWLAAYRFRSPRPTLRLATIPFMAYVLLTPTLHPWYMLILLAFLPFLPPAETESRWLWLTLAPWLYLSATLSFSYLTYLDPLDYQELAWVRQIEWLPTLALLLLSVAGLSWLWWRGR